MRKKSSGIVVVIMLLALSGLKAQDPHFSQFNAAPLVLNPALTGFFNGDYRVCANYRSQWGSFVTNPFRTASASFEMSVLKGKLVDDNLAFGAVFYNDMAGSGGFGRNSALVSASYKKTLGYFVKHTLSAGLSLGFMQDKVDASKLTFDNQYNGVAFDPTLPSGVLINSSKYAFDLNAGALYQVLPTKHINLYFGVSVNHITGPKLDLLQGSSYSIPQRYTAHFGGEFSITNHFNVLPSAMFQLQAGAREELIGSYVQFVFDYHNDAETAFSLGLWLRESQITSDALIIGARIDFQHFTFGASYDVNVSTLREVSQSRGAYEISLIYTGNFVTRGKRKLSIPCPQL